MNDLRSAYMAMVCLSNAGGCGWFVEPWFIAEGWFKAPFIAASGFCCMPPTACWPLNRGLERGVLYGLAPTAAEGGGIDPPPDGGLGRV